MRYARTRLVLGIILAGAIAIAIGCASSPRVPLNEIEALPDGTVLVALTITNARTRDAIDPHIYLVGRGRHFLGVVGGMGGTKSRLVDTRWFDPEGCMRIVARFVGKGELRFDRFCWRRGEVIEVTLYDPFNPISAWSHR